MAVHLARGVSNTGQEIFPAESVSNAVKAASPVRSQITHQQTNGKVSIDGSGEGPQSQYLSGQTVCAFYCL